MNRNTLNSQLIGESPQNITKVADQGGKFSGYKVQTAVSDSLKSYYNEHYFSVDCLNQMNYIKLNELDICFSSSTPGADDPGKQAQDRQVPENLLLPFLNAKLVSQWTGLSVSEVERRSECALSRTNILNSQLIQVPTENITEVTTQEKEFSGEVQTPKDSNPLAVSDSLKTYYNEHYFNVNYLNQMNYIELNEFDIYFSSSTSDTDEAQKNAPENQLSESLLLPYIDAKLVSQWTGLSVPELERRRSEYLSRTNILNSEFIEKSTWNTPEVTTSEEEFSYWEIHPITQGSNIGLNELHICFSPSTLDTDTDEAKKEAQEPQIPDNLLSLDAKRGLSATDLWVPEIERRREYARKRNLENNLI